jgi:hypothetical protein
LVTKTRGTPRAFEQDLLLLEFLEQANDWVSKFSFDMTGPFRLAIGEEQRVLGNLIQVAETGLQEKPAATIQQMLSQQVKALEAARSQLERIELPEYLTLATLVSYEIATPLTGQAPRRKTTELRQADVTLTVKIPDALSIGFGEAVDLPYDISPMFDLLEGDTSAAGQKAHGERRVVALNDPSRWGITPPAPEPTITVQHCEWQWHFTIAPQSEGLMAAFHRLQSVRSWVEDGVLPREFFGVVTRKRDLAKLAADQGYRVFLSTKEQPNRDVG